MPQIYVGPWEKRDLDGTGSPCWCGPEESTHALDLRPADADEEGQGVFVLPDGASGPRGPFRHIGDSWNDRPSNPAIRFLDVTRNNAGTVWELVSHLLMDKADPAGEAFCRPLMPKRNGQLKVRLGPLVVEDKMVRQHRHRNKVMDVKKRTALKLADDGDTLERWLGFQKRLGWAENEVKLDSLRDRRPKRPQTTYTESFDQADSTTLGPDLTWTEVQSTSWETVSNRAYSSLNNYPQATAGSALSADDMSCEADIEFGSGSSYGGINVRANTSNQESYWHWVRFNNSHGIFRIGTGGGRTSIASYSYTTGSSTNHTLKIVADGSDIEVFIGGVSQTSVTDTNITGSVRAGIQAYSPFYVDDFSYTDDIGGGGGGISYVQLESGVRGYARGYWIRGAN